MLRTAGMWGGDPGFAVVAADNLLGVETEGWGWGTLNSIPNTLNMMNEQVYLFIRSIM